MDTYSMPKSPTARLGIPRYEDSETAAFSTQVNAISEAVDAKAELRLVNRPLEVNATAVAQDRIIFKGTGGGSGYTATLPVPAAEARIAVLNETTATKECKVKVNTGKIYGDFVAGATEITLSVGQHVELVSDGTNWFIVAGEPKREAKYAAWAKVATGVTTYEFEPSGTRPTFVAFEVEKNSGTTNVTISVGGEVVYKSVAVEGTFPAVSFGLPVNPGQILKVECVTAGKINVYTSVLAD
jgi:hypothetical protein